MLTGWPVIVGCAVLGAGFGATAAPVARRLLTGEEHARLASAPVFAVATAAILGLLAWRFGLHLDLAAYCWLGATSVPLTAVDLVEHRLPNALVLPLYPVLLGVFGVDASAEHAAGPFVRAVLAMVAVFVGYLALAMLTGGGVGSGDVKLAGAVGLALGWQSWPAVVAGIMAGFVIGAGTGLALIAAHKASRNTPIPFGPAILLGTLFALLLRV